MDGDYRFLQELSTRQLEDLLYQTLNDEQENVEYITYILEVIEAREKNNPENHLSDVRLAWEDFQEKYNSPDSEKTSLYDFEVLGSDEDSQSKHKDKTRTITLGRKIMLAALVACLAFSMAISASGIDIAKVIASWTQNIFSFSYPQSTGSTSSHIAEDQGEAFGNLQDALDAVEIDEFNAPTFIPDGFVQDGDVVVFSHLMSKEIQAYFTFEDRTISISVTKFNESYSVQHEKDGNPVETYDINGITHYLFTNNGRTTAAWNTNSSECSIRGDITLEEMKAILNSMY